MPATGRAAPLIATCSRTRGNWKPRSRRSRTRSDRFSTLGPARLAHSFPMAKKAAAHGGAWKVAYADFVTAMMALFMVLWISAQDEKIVIATSQYFKNPFLAAAADATSG